MYNSLAQRVCAIAGKFVVNNALLFVLIALVCIVVGDFYSRFFKINKNTDHVDIMKAYNDLQLRRKYDRIKRLNGG